MGKYKKKPVVIEAVQLLPNEESISQCVRFLYNMENSGTTQKVDWKSVMEDGGMYIYTLEGKMKASFNDYIIRGVSGEYYPCRADIFEKTYEKVE